MRVWICALLLLVGAAFASTNLKLYMKDGTVHLVKEYKVEGDRVKFYSVDRGEWEEVPSELVDLKRTETESAERKAARDEEVKLITQEDKAKRALDDEVLKIPQDPGVYSLEGGTLHIFKQAESKVHTNKGRVLLKAAVPVPLIPGKATVELEQPHSLNLSKAARPDLYIQLDKEEHFALIKLTPHHEVRIAERVSIMPVVKESVEEVDEVQIFKKQMTESGLFKFWPQEPLKPGEYAVIQYTPGKMDPQIWDFAYKP